MNNFDFSPHIKQGHLLIKYADKSNYTGFINLSSNQLEHRLFRTAFSSFIHEFDSGLINQYVYNREFVQRASSYFGVKSSEFIVTSGSDSAIYILLDALTRTTKSIILQTPNYIPYLDYSILNGVEVKEVNFINRSEQEHVDDMINMMRSTKSSTVIIANPNNFLGTRLSLEAIKRILLIAQECGHLVLLDEAYCAFSDYEHVSLLKSFKNMIIVRTFSKSHGMAGLRLGCIMADSFIISYVKKTGLEKAVSIVAISYFDYLVRNHSIITTVKTEISNSKSDFINWLNKHFPEWYIYSSFTNFITIDAGKVEEAESVTEYLYQNKIIIKHLPINNTKSSLIRFTMCEPTVMATVKSVLLSYRNYQ